MCYDTDRRSALPEMKASRSLQQEAQLNIVMTSNLLVDSLERLVRPYGLTGTQYNVLRILGGVEAEGLGRNEIRERLLSRMPDATRLLDRMEKAGLVSRVRDAEDRRQVTSRITAKGIVLVSELDPIVEAGYRRHLENLSEKQVRKLIKLLTLVRETT